MTLIEKDAHWPKTEALDGEAHMRKFVDVSLSRIVAEGVNEWMYKTGRAPTDVIFGCKAILLLREETARVSAVVAPTNQYRGLTFHRDFDAEGVVLLTREPR